MEISCDASLLLQALRIGSYEQEEHAARAYDEAVRSLRLDVETNFPPRGPALSSLHHHAAGREPVPPRCSHSPA